MGEMGPCGPCSEIHIDIRTQEERQKIDGYTLVNQDHPLVVEIWNLVFIQFNRMSNGSLETLPRKHIDTGMGLERLVMAIQGAKSNYDTDVFMPVISYVADKAGVKYGEDDRTDIAIRVISDHIRAITFVIADGQMPSNNQAGYVIRRILRRAVRYGYTFLGFKAPFLYDVVALVAKQFQDVFPEANSQLEFIQNVVKREEQTFLETLEKGLNTLNQIINQIIQNNDGSPIDGQVVFQLYDTFGFPVDLTALIASEQGLSWDKAGFEKAMQEQKTRSKTSNLSENTDWIQVHEGESEFVGYDYHHTKTYVLQYRQVNRQVKQKKKTFYQIVLGKTPFYAESGGQIGDKGVLRFGDEEIAVLDTQKENQIFVHLTERLPKDIKGICSAEIDVQARKDITRHHTATHLMHAALQEVLGDHVEQRGSLVRADSLRFDFSHYQKVTPEQCQQIEHIVNQKISLNLVKEERRNMPIAQAKRRGSKSLIWREIR